MSNLKWLMVYALVGYAAVLALLYVTQRAMQYFPERFRTAPAAAGLPQAEEVVLDRALRGRAHRALGRIARFRGSGRAGGANAGRLPHPAVAIYLRSRCRRADILVRAGAVPHEGPVPIRLAHRQGDGSGADSAR